MTIRTRLLLGYGYLVTLAVVMAVVSAMGLQRFSREQGRVVDASSARVGAGIALLRALQAERAASALALRGEPGAAAGLAAAEGTTDAALVRAGTTLTTARERAVAGTIDLRVRELRARRRAALEEARGGRLSGEAALAATSELTLLTSAAEAQVAELLDAGLAQGLASERAAHTAALRWAVVQGALVALALLSAGFLSRGLQREVLGRVTELAEVAADQARGERGRRLRLRGDDELALVADQLNEALDRRDASQASAEGQLAHQRQLVLGLAAACGPSAVLGLDGAVVVCTLRDRERARLVELAARVRDQRALVDPLAPVERVVGAGDDGAGGYALRLLVAGGRAVGWLATPREGAAPPAAASPATASPVAASGVAPAAVGGLKPEA